MPFRGEIWEHNEDRDVGTRWQYNWVDTVFVCGVEDSWVWYTHIIDFNNLGSHRKAWDKARVDEFEKRYQFTHHAAAPKSYWRKKATGELTQIIALKDDGWKDIFVYYDLNKIDIHYFFSYFKPASKEDVLAAIAREKQVKRSTKKLKRRIAAVKGEPGVAYEEEKTCPDK